VKKFIKDIDIGIIGGSGFYEIDGFSQLEEHVLDTPFGNPSDAYLVGELHGVRVAVLPRHGRGHLMLPSELNYRANIYGFKSLGISNIIAITAVGSLQEHMPPMDMVIPDQLIDRTRRSQSTFFGNGIAAHVSFADPFCPDLSKLLYEAAAPIVKRVHMGGTLVTIEGPSFSTRAESKLFQRLGCDIIGMTTFHEAKLAREAEICYAALAMVTDYDCWKEQSKDEVTVETVVANMKKNSYKAKSIIANVLPLIAQNRTCMCTKSLNGAIMTTAELISPQTRKKLALLLAGRI
jgi:5'-methylthioadenosine phosphorylase